MFVLLEAGAIVGPRWLELLTAALTRAGVGLAGPRQTGPGTSRAASSEHFGLGAGAGAEPLKAVRRDAALLLRRFGSRRPYARARSTPSAISATPSAAK